MTIPTQTKAHNALAKFLHVACELSLPKYDIAKKILVAATQKLAL
jgi:hypothetical protein